MPALAPAALVAHPTQRPNNLRAVLESSSEEL